ncbi:hypothetical protein [Haloarcula amylovorans]|uniref:hypothetical protein n=1 Tax=Haloarcula amylovorans TaxID=2562280 RepID=UPI00107605C3|nr:hypothetical protein [Halomicroarcula amylolytica]
MSESAGVPEPDFEQLHAAVERLLDETVDREEALELSAEDLHVDVPIRFGEDAPRARWGFDGDVTITVEGVRGPLREWIELHEDRIVESDD